MGAFEDLYNHFEKNMGNIGATRGIFREDNAARPIEAEDGDIRYMSKDDKEEALKTIADHEKNELERTLLGIRRNREDEKGQPTEKSMELLKDRPRDPNAKYKTPAYSERGNWKNDWTEDVARWAGAIAGIKGDTRREAGSDWRPGMGGAPKGSPKARKRDAIYQRAIERGEDAWNKQRQKINEKKGRSTQKAMLIEKGMSPALATLLAAAAGWALSADTASKGVPPEMAAEWERAQSREDKRRLQEEMLRRMKRMRKSDDDPFLDSLPAFADLHTFYKEENPFAWQGEFDEDDYDFDAESDPQWDAHSKDDAEHSFATDQGGGGTEPNIDDFHPESGARINNHGQGAHNVQNWAKGVQQQTGIPLVNKLGEPHDDIYTHHG